MNDAVDVRIGEITPTLSSAWCTVTFEHSLVQRQPKYKKLKSNQFYSSGTIPVIDQGEAFIAGYTDDRTAVFSGPLPVIIFGDHTRRFKYIDFEFAIGADGTRPLYPCDALSPKFFYHYLTALKLESQGYSRHYRFLKEASVPIPPLNEQCRIVKKLELLQSKLNDCNVRLDRIPTILKRFRQSVLAAACSGRLTDDWREQHPAGDKNGSTRVGFDHEFPETWRTTNLGKLASLITSGSRGWAKFYADTGSTFIRAQNINSDVLNLDDVAFVQLPNRAEGVRTKVHRNDILVTITGANVTKAALVDVDLDDAYISQHVALVRFYEPSSAAFLFLWTVSPSHGRRQLQDAAYGQGKPGLNLDNIRDVDVMMPPVDEQIEIVRRVKSLFTLADQLEARYKKGKTYVDKLTQSILAKAFRGELVPQDPNDEPAEKLLERIRAEEPMRSKTRISA